MLLKTPLFKTKDSPPRRTLRQLLSRDDLVYAAGAWDGASAAVAESVGVEAVFTGGWMIAASAGVPDADLYSKADSLRAVRTVASRTTAAVIADMDAGFGNAAHVYHAVQAMETAGASAIAIEDQVTPIMACHWVAGAREIHERDFAVAKVRAAVDARTNPETVVIARTDAEGDEIYRRGEAFAAAGADLVFAIASSEDFDIDCWRRLRDVSGVPLVIALMPGTWQEKEFTADVMRDVGIQLALVGVQPFNAAMAAARRVYQQIVDAVPVPRLAEGALTTQEFAEIIGLFDVIELEREYTGELVQAQAST